jgi:hypothetical protein
MAGRCSSLAKMPLPMSAMPIVIMVNGVGTVFPRCC